MANIRRIIMLLITGTLLVLARTGEEVYQEICSKCHIAYIPEDKLKKNFDEYNNTLLKLKAPPVSQIAIAMKKNLGSPNTSEKMRRLEVSAFIADYILYPDKKKSVLSDKVRKHFGIMPSLKGKISSEDIEIISNFAYDFDPKKYIKSRHNDVPFKKILHRARKENKIIVVEAMTSRCHFCKKMRKGALSDPRVMAILQKEFIMVSIDLSKENLPLNMDVSMTPTFFFIFVNKREDIAKIKRIPGAWSTQDFLDILKESIKAKKQYIK
ncbi:MAG: thioredoxin family protein [Sulfurovum sp.]|nr:thioredoxin family protein [Sulfurovum sp.]